MGRPWPYCCPEGDAPAAFKSSSFRDGLTMKKSILIGTVIPIRFDPVAERISEAVG